MVYDKAPDPGKVLSNIIPPIDMQELCFICLLRAFPCGIEVDGQGKFTSFL